MGKVAALCVAVVAVLAAPASAGAVSPPRVLVTGDSMMAVIEGALVEELRARGAEVQTESLVGSGITKPFVVDWVEHAWGQARVLAPDATVAFLGAGDVYAIRTRGRRARCCGPAWVAAYADRVRRMTKGWRDGGGRPLARVYWLTLPAPRDGGLARVFSAVNRAIRRGVLAAGPRAELVGLYSVFTPGGRFRRRMAGDSGSAEVVREPDGVHLAPAGARIAAQMVAQALASDRAVP